MRADVVVVPIAELTIRPNLRIHTKLTFPICISDLLEDISDNHLFIKKIGKISDLMLTLVLISVFF